MSTTELGEGNVLRAVAERPYRHLPAPRGMWFGAVERGRHALPGDERGGIRYFHERGAVRTHSGTDGSRGASRKLRNTSLAHRSS